MWNRSGTPWMPSASGSTLERHHVDAERTVDQMLPGGLLRGLRPFERAPERIEHITPSFPIFQLRRRPVPHVPSQWFLPPGSPEKIAPGDSSTRRRPCAAGSEWLWPARPGLRCRFSASWPAPQARWSPAPFARARFPVRSGPAAGRCSPGFQSLLRSGIRATFPGTGRVMGHKSVVPDFAFPKIENGGIGGIQVLDDQAAGLRRVVAAQSTGRGQPVMNTRWSGVLLAGARKSMGSSVNFRGVTGAGHRFRISEPQ